MRTIILVTYTISQSVQRLRIVRQLELRMQYAGKS